MPSRSERQRRALEAKFGHAWVKAHHFDKVVARGESASSSKAKRKKR